MGSPDGNWFPWLDSELTGAGLSVVRPKLPTPEGQSLSAWQQALKDRCGALDATRDVIVGHSAGANFALRLCENQAVYALFLIAPFISALGIAEYDRLNETFINSDLSGDAIRMNCANILLFHGDNDPYVPLTQAIAIHRKLGAPLTVIRSGGHLNLESGYNTFPLLLSEILRIVHAH